MQKLQIQPWLGLLMFWVLTKWDGQKAGLEKEWVLPSRRAVSVHNAHLTFNAHQCQLAKWDGSCLFCVCVFLLKESVWERQLSCLLLLVQTLPDYLWQPTSQQMGVLVWYGKSGGIYLSYPWVCDGRNWITHCSSECFTYKSLVVSQIWLCPLPYTNEVLITQKNNTGEHHTDQKKALLCLERRGKAREGMKGRRLTAVL